MLMPFQVSGALTAQWDEDKLPERGVDILAHRLSRQSIISSIEGWYEEILRLHDGSLESASSV